MILDEFFKVFQHEFDRPSTQIKHIKSSIKRKYSRHKVELRIIEKRTIATTNTKIIEEKKTLSNAKIEEE